MDSRPKRGDGHFLFKATKPHFFKIILDDTISSMKLGIPRKFVRRYGSDLSSPAVQKVLSGEQWKTIHSASPMEITGSLMLNKNSQSQRLENENDVSILGHSFPSPKTKDKSPLQFPQPHKKMKVENPTENTNAQLPTGKFEGLSNEKKTLDGAVARRRPLTAEEKANALHRASTNFKSGNPYFMVAMPPLFLHSLNIPSSVAREYFNKSGAVTLNTVDGKTWPVL
ncbi:B3 domain-containing protein REM19-like [Hevea brasiliensis]|uniref:B3 domain-containing protein REM19-like n=1 Tax=Hevea brasiliensis TaxID=3981 RepID=UPI0025F6FDE6|nr:B3 domain-containing protein REM19-like [Hevea brasiliensis]